MATKSGYDYFMRRSLSALVAVFGLVFLSSLFVSDAHSQINGPPASVTSPGFGGRPINGPPASVTSVGPRGYGNGQFVSPFDRAGFEALRQQRDVLRAARRGQESQQGRRFHNGRRDSAPYVPYFSYAVPVPYAADLGEPDDTEEAPPADSDENYQGGPTVFDRRGNGANSYVPVPRDVPRAHPAEQTPQAQNSAPTPEPLDPTTLVFKDGHKLEVENYAIIGPTLFDMTPGHSRKVPLQDLDLEATRRENDARGVNFQLPISSQAN